MFEARRRRPVHEHVVRGAAARRGRGREEPVALIYDREFAELLSEAGRDLWRFVAWTDGEDAGDPTLEELIRSNEDSDLDPPRSRAIS